jgi:hypothetical protein
VVNRAHAPSVATVAAEATTVVVAGAARKRHGSPARRADLRIIARHCDRSAIDADLSTILHVALLAVAVAAIIAAVATLHHATTIAHRRTRRRIAGSQEAGDNKEGEVEFHLKRGV